MPTAPEFGNIPRKIGKVEITHQSYPKEAGGTNGNIGIARKIAVNLKAEENGAQHQHRSALLFVVPENLIYYYR